MLATFIGCRNRGPSTEPLELENYALNERILQLEIELAQRQSKLERACEDEKLAKENKDRSSSSGSRSSDRPRDDDPVGPEIDLGDPVDPNDPDRRNLPSAPRFQGRSGSAGRGMLPTSTSSRISYLTINSEETAGLAHSRAAAGDGLSVVLEPRDASGKLIAAAGHVAIAAWDQELLDRYQGDRQRQTAAQVGVWTFTTSEIQGRLDKSPDGRIRFQLPWSGKRPEHSDLRLYVRYVVPDGRELRAELPVTVALSSGSPRQSKSSATSLEPPAPPLLVPETNREPEPVRAKPADEPEEVPAREASRRPSWSPYR